MARLILSVCDVVHLAAALCAHMHLAKVHYFVVTVRIRIETTRCNCTTCDLAITMSDARPHRLSFSDGAVRLSVDW